MNSTDRVNSNSTDLNTQVKLLESRLNNAVRSIEANEKEIEKLQSQLNGLGDMVESLKENLRIAAEHEARLSPLEQAVVFYDDYENCDLLSRTSHVRAARLLSKWETWSVPRPEGRGLHTQHENVKTLYENAFNEDLQSVQFTRTFDAAENLTNGKLKHMTDEKGHHQLLSQPGRTIYTNKEQLTED